MFRGNGVVEESMIPVGKEMAEALLESDESTASLSEHSIEKEGFDDFALKTSNIGFGQTFEPVASHPHLTPKKGPAFSSAMTVRPPPGLQSTSPSWRNNGRPLVSLMDRRYVALDCEMVGVGPEGKRSVLARVSVVDFYGRCLLDNFVKVEERVTDYRTHVTGFVSGDSTLENAVPYAICRKQVIRLIRHKILVGHGLDNDLAVLGVTHPWYNIRDTATYIPLQRMNRFGRPCPRRLRDLAYSYLGLTIQKSGQPHCPIEDACAAMALYRSMQHDWDYEIDGRRRGLVGHFDHRHYTPTSGRHGFQQI